MKVITGLAFPTINIVLESPQEAMEMLAAFNSILPLKDFFGRHAPKGWEPKDRYNELWCPIHHVLEQRGFYKD